MDTENPKVGEIIICSKDKGKFTPIKEFTGKAIITIGGGDNKTYIVEEKDKISNEVKSIQTREYFNNINFDRLNSECNNDLPDIVYDNYNDNNKYIEEFKVNNEDHISEYSEQNNENINDFSIKKHNQINSNLIEKESFNNNNINEQELDD